MQRCNTKHQKFSMLWALALAIVALVAIPPQAALAQDTCSAGVDPSVVTAAPFFVGDTIRETIEIQATSINGGTTATIDDATIKLGCQSGFGTISLENCVADPAKSFVGYVSTDCPGVDHWNTSMPDANTVVFTAVDATDTADPLELGEDGFCLITYDVQIDSASTDATPFTITQAQGFDAVCDNDAEDASARGTLALTIAVCEVTVDKQVSCDGGDTYVDVTDLDDTPIEDPENLVGDDAGLIGDGNCDPGENCTSQVLGCIGWEGFDPGGPDGPMDAEPVLGKWVIENTGNVNLYNCELSDTNSLLLETGLIALLNDPLAPGGTETVEDSGLCTDAFDDLEPNTATVNCACEDEPLIEADPVATASDTADVNCQEPGLTLTKLCDPQDTLVNDVTVTATNTGEAGLINCTMSDFVVAGDPECPAEDPMTNGDEVTLTGLAQPFDLAALGEESATGMITDLAANACNTGFITCEIDSGDGSPVLDPISGLAKTITRQDDDVCEVQGEDCLTRTPGFWGTHPHVTDDYLPFSVCGVDIDNVSTGQGSAIQNMCSVGKDPKDNEVSSQQVQLERQCTAAVLNTIATEEEFDASCDSAYPGVADLIADCCTGEGSICDSGLAPGELGVNDRTINSCIGALDAFNNSDDAEPEDLTGTPFESPGPADPSVCQDSKNDGFINDGTDRATVCKGKGCN